MITHFLNTKFRINLPGHLYAIVPAILLTALGFFLSESAFPLLKKVCFLAAYLLCGYYVLLATVRNFIKGDFFDENSLMSLATIGAIAINQLPEAVSVMLFFRIGELFQDLSLDRSRKSIRALLAVRPDYARLMIDGKSETVSPEKVEIGSTIIVRPGEKIPLDGEIISGAASIDTSPLTGESLPRPARPGDAVMAGTLNLSGLISIKVTKIFSESSVSKILNLVEEASERKAPAEKFITTFAGYYTPSVVFTALAIAVLPPLLIAEAAFSTWFYRALVLMVIACPCALVISIPLAYFGGIGGASRKGILVKGAGYLDVLTKVKAIAFDKTGTLTGPIFELKEIVPQDHLSAEELLRYAALAEAHSKHPVASTLRQAYKPDESDADIVHSYTEIPGSGIKAVIGNQTVLFGNEHLLRQHGVSFKTTAAEAATVHLALDGRYAGFLTLIEKPKPRVQETLAALKAKGIKKIVMLTGDHKAPAHVIADQLGITDVRTDLLPDGKVHELENIKAELSAAHKLAFVGDGINDAPVLTRADLGIAMGALGSEAAIEVADLVIMEDNPFKVVEALEIAHKTRNLVWQNIILALSVKGVFIILGAYGVADIWEAIIADVGVALVAIFNAARAVRW